VLKSHRSALDRQITEAVLIQVAGPDMLLNSRGEWNICKIPRLILDDEEPQEDWVSKRSKRKSISSDQGPSSITSGSSSGETGGGEGSMEYSVVSELSSTDVDVSNCNGSKTKKSRLAEPTLSITSGLSTAVEKDITRSDCTEFGQDCTSGGVTERAINALGKGVKNGKREENKRKKGKVEDLANSEVRDVSDTVLPILITGKRKYVKKDTAYWSGKKRKGKE